VVDPLTRLAERYLMTVVSSSATARLAACFRAAGLDPIFPEALRFSAEDSLPVPTSKPDPAVYLHACRQAGVDPRSGLAVEARSSRCSPPWRPASPRSATSSSCSPASGPTANEGCARPAS
jgi:beta-phosphoglucomutase-like phosphatase (HAD superfamily)